MQPLRRLVTAPDGIATEPFAWVARGQVLAWRRGERVRVDLDMHRDLLAGGVPVLWGDDMALYTGDQQTTNPHYVNGQAVALNEAAVKALVPSGYTTYTFTDTYTHSIRGAMVAYRKGRSYHLLNADVTLLLSLSAPMVAA
jgi:hypothetical protein